MVDEEDAEPPPDEDHTPWVEDPDGVDAAVQASLDARDISDPALMPRMTGASINELTTYQSLFILETMGGPPGDRSALLGAIDPFAQPASAAQDLPAVGVLTTHEQTWTQQGLSFGNLLHSVCLAPGEVTQVAVVDWQRQTAGTSSQTTDQSEDVASLADQTRAANEIQNAVAREAQSGGSSTSATAATAQAGVSIGGLFGAVSASGSASTTSAMTAQFSLGSRNLAASSTAALSQRTAEKSQSLRSRRAAVIKEVSEREAENLSSRVLANYNRRHALNIEYFEVLQLYAIETRLSSWDRCLFVPMQLIDFSKQEVIKQHKASLTRFFIETGRAALVEQLLFDDDSKAAVQLDQEIQRARDAIAADTAKLKEQDDRWALLNRAKPLAETHEALVTASKAGADVRASIGAVAAEYAAVAQSDKGKWLPPLEPGANNAIAARMQDAQRTAEAIRRVSGTLEQHKASLSALEANRAALRLSTSERLMAEQLALSQAIWMQMDPFRVYRMLAKHTLDGEALAMLVDPYPVGVFGNYLAFRWGFARTEAGAAKRKDFESAYMTDSAAQPTVTSTIAVPTSGVFAEAVLGRGQAAETIDDTRLWDWEAFPIPILPTGLKSLVRDRAKGMSLEPDGLDSALAELRATNPADASRLEGMLAALSNGDTFRDMGGLAQAVTLADKVAAISGAGAQDAGQRAAEIHGKILDTFVEVLNSDVGKAAVAEFMLPGSGAALLGAGGSNGKSPKED